MKNPRNKDPKAPESDNILTPDIQFEAALAELETLVEQMEGGSLSLDESLQAFERGIALTRHCAKALAQAELKVQTLTADNTLEEFDIGDVDDN
ncbi:MAG: exodeoxyribonuclease VII small subunit [bacterium]